MLLVATYPALVNLIPSARRLEHGNFQRSAASEKHEGSNSCHLRYAAYSAKTCHTCKLYPEVFTSILGQYIIVPVC